MRHIIITNPGNTILGCLPKRNENICAPMFASSYSSSPICLSTHNWKNNLYAYPTLQTIPSTKRGKLVDMRACYERQAQKTDCIAPLLYHRKGKHANRNRPGAAREQGTFEGEKNFVSWYWQQLHLFVYIYYNSTCILTYTGFKSVNFKT